ncbi:acyltransferase [Hymenobacter sp. RP-2-7]|uniref:Acyltransferase n=1 Tax=Hymenobacter polaris TaxID=2682546 RepID=A0A7Y0AI85_9BACT|nr:acyltransferase [Hymenobacter polaris]
MSPAASPLHFGLLDGLRGVAALAVVLFHFMELVETKPANNFIAHAYLAVDFFFCLSGFVIAYAYDARLAQLGVGRFLRRRLIRLHPLVVVGALLGLLTFWLDPFSHLVDQYATRLPLLLLSSCLLVPYPVVTERYANLFHLNPPTWSLFWEYIANVAYALVLVRLPARLLKILLVPAAIALCYEARRTGWLGGGWGREDAIAGFLRVTFSFLMGLLLYRANWLIRSRLGFGALALLLLGALLLPFIDRINWRVDSLVVLFYFPLLIALGAGGQLTPRYAKLCRFLGDISYPLYIVHYPFIWVFFSYLHKYQPPLSTLALVIPTAMLALVLLAYAVLKWIDIPVRSYLTRTFDQPTTLVSNRQAPAPVAPAAHP